MIVAFIRQTTILRQSSKACAVEICQVAVQETECLRNSVSQHALSGFFAILAERNHQMLGTRPHPLAQNRRNRASTSEWWSSSMYPYFLVSIFSLSVGVMFLGRFFLAREHLGVLTRSPHLTAKATLDCVLFLAVLFDRRTSRARSPWGVSSFNSTQSQSSSSSSLPLHHCLEPHAQ